MSVCDSVWFAKLTSLGVHCLLPVASLAIKCIGQRTLRRTAVGQTLRSGIVSASSNTYSDRQSGNADVNMPNHTVVKPVKSGLMSVTVPVISAWGVVIVATLADWLRPRVGGVLFASGLCQVPNGMSTLTTLSRSLMVAMRTLRIYRRSIRLATCERATILAKGSRLGCYEVTDAC